MQPSDPLYAQQWHFDHLGSIEKIWDEYSGAGITVGIYDGGVLLTHPDLAANYDPSLRVIVDGEPIDGEPKVGTPSAHGTRVLGLIAAANNGVGIIGVAWGSTFASIDFLDDSSEAYNETSVFDQLGNFDVTNHSWNALPETAYGPIANLYGPGTYAGVNIQYEAASANGRGGLGTILVQAVANLDIDASYSGLNTSRFTISVGGIQEDGFAYSLSNYGTSLLVTAPAVNMVTTHVPGVSADTDGYVDATENAAFPPDGLAGTSLAAPLVSGVAALMLDANAGLGWRDVQNIIAASATHTGSAIGAVTPGTNENSNWFINAAANWNGGGMHFSNDYGYGAVDAYAAVRMAEVWSLFGAAQTSSNEQSWFTLDEADQAIPDNDALEFGVSLSASPDIEIEHVELRIDLIHTDYTQLRIFLTSPGGTEIQLYDGSGGTDATADSFFNWTYGGEALRGENVAGTWTVRIEDVAENETGTLLWYNLVAYGSAASTNDVCHYTDEFLAMKDLESSRSTLADTGGTDWIDAAAVTGNITLNLNAGTTTKVNGVNWFNIAAGTTIEHAVTGDGNDTLTGNTAANRLHGMRGNDTLDGGLGNDQMFGGKGNDTYVVSQTGDIADETGGNGTDTVKAGITFSLNDAVHAKGSIEHLTLTGAAAVNATGNGLANTLTGNSAANTLDGLGGNDTMRGLGGNDTYVVAQTGDVVDETGGSGIDLVKSAITFSLANATRVKGTVENLTLTGGGAINATGNGLANTLTGNNAANTLDGLGGNDTMRGMGGNDTYVVAQSGDVVDETGGSGVDLVKSAISFSLANIARVKGSVENLTLTGSAKIDATGNTLANMLAGNAGVNLINGAAGNDRMTGGANADTFAFDTALNASTNVDHVTDFLPGTDTLRLDASIFTKLKLGDLKKKAFFAKDGASKAKDKQDRVIYDSDSGEVRFDKDGKGKTKAVLFAVLDGDPDLAHTDVLVVA